MNLWIKSLAALSLFAGSAFFNTPVGAAPNTVALSTTALPAPAPAQNALNSLTGRADSPLPSGTKLLSIRLADGLATVDFSQELRDNFTGGDSDETHTVNAILRTLGQFPTIDRVQLLVDGKPLDSLGGLLDLSSPLPVLRPAANTSLAQPAKRWLHRKAHPAAKAVEVLSTDEIN